MSTIVLAACWPIQCSPSQKSVLIALASISDDSGWCWPELSELVAYTCLSRSTVIKALGDLEASSFIEGMRTPGRATQYRIRVEPTGGQK